MAAITIFCKQCKVGYAAIGVIPSVCPACEKETTWTTKWPHEDPGFPFRITKTDRKFLRSMRIAADEPPS